MLMTLLPAPLMAVWELLKAVVLYHFVLSSLCGVPQASFAGEAVLLPACPLPELDHLSLARLAVGLWCRSILR